MCIISQKEALRRVCKLSRNSLDNKTELSAKISQLLLGSTLYKNCSSIFIYSSYGSEVDTAAIIASAFADGKKVAFPVCIDGDGTMKFYYVDSLSELSEGRYGILAPPKNNEAYFGDERTLCIVPGLSFAPDGYRLGYGKGYYDRFLTRFKGISIGLCYGACLRDELPRDEYDQKVNYLITDKRIYNFT